MKISVVTCSYQQGKFLEETILSVLSQDYDDLEFIIIDGGSTDESVEIIRKYERRIDYWVSERDDGQTDALRKGFARASGDVMCWLCSDDLFLPGTLPEIARYFKENPLCRAVYGDALWIDKQSKPIRPKKEIAFHKGIFLYDHNYVPQPSMFWRRDLYEEVGGLDATFDLAMDGDLWWRFSEVTDIGHISCYLSCMRYYEEQKTRKLSSKARAENERIIQRATGATAGIELRLRRAIAKSARVALKLFAGGYTASVPADFALRSHTQNVR